ncbi:MAG: sulfotransferase domain-containing protein [Oleiphilaceae bacterium]|nr:sulfotransferase domain-containing protein [Oleiphilaceae bacterium]
MSTWLQSLFEQHPDISYAYRTNYFQLYNSTFDKGLEWYRAQFIGKGRLFLESDEHLLLPEIDQNLWMNKSNLAKVQEVLENISASSFDSLKVIFVYRSQVDMILSRYIQFVRSGGKLNFNQFFDLTFRGEKYLDYFDYRFGKLHELMFDAFGSENVFSINIDDFKLRKANILDELASFIGVPILDSSLPQSAVNVSPSTAALKMQLMLNKLMVARKKTHVERAKTRFGYLAWKGPMKLIEMVDSRIIKDKKRYALMTDEQIEEIKNTFAEDNKLLAAITSQDFKQYSTWLPK